MQRTPSAIHSLRPQVAVLSCAIALLAHGPAAAAPVILTSDPPPFMRNGVLMAPTRAVLQFMGAEVGFDQGEITATHHYHGWQLRLKVNSAVATLDGARVQLPQPTIMIRQISFLPLKAIVEALGGTYHAAGEDGAAIGFGGRIGVVPVGRSWDDLLHTDGLYCTKTWPLLKDLHGFDNGGSLPAVPIRPLAEWLGLRYQRAESTITITGPQTKIQLTIGSPVARVGEVPAKEVRLYLPVRLNGPVPTIAFRSVEELFGVTTEFMRRSTFVQQAGGVLSAPVGLVQHAERRGSILFHATPPAVTAELIAAILRHEQEDTDVDETIKAYRQSYGRMYLYHGLGVAEDYAVVDCCFCGADGAWLYLKKKAGKWTYLGAFSSCCGDTPKEVTDIPRRVLRQLHPGWTEEWFHNHDHYLDPSP